MDVHLFQCLIKDGGLKLTSQTEVVQTPRSRSQTEEERFRATEDATQIGGGCHGTGFREYRTKYIA